ncbi:MAG TPA: hypothetical protein VG737_13550 [Cyclobacteriaceae bacterium]|nr:hypothetical protein [Cyclobacteriaceae bacterium]
MRLKKILLYPFSTEFFYFENYAWVTELAWRMNARLQLITTTSLSENLSSTRDAIYDSLLQAQGYYLQHYHSGSNSGEIKSEPYIAEGDLGSALMTHLKNNPVDVVVLDASFLSRNYKKLGDIVESSGGVIALPRHPVTTNEKSKSDQFYDTLRRSELYKLPENFFSTLGSDRTVFNYLRKFFQRKKR